MSTILSKYHIKSKIFVFQKYDVFQDIKALLVLIPALLGLKGNLDMCLASRLSTQANLGNMGSYQELFKMIIGNLLLVQVSIAPHLIPIIKIKDLISNLF